MDDRSLDEQALAASQLALALDIGATKIAGCLVDQDGVVLERQSKITPHGSEDNVWWAVADVIDHLRHSIPGRQIIGIGVGSAGPMDLAAGTVSPVKIPSWRRFPLVDRLAEIVPGVPVCLAGDGICAAAGEHWRGAGKDTADVLTVVVSTGVGGGLVQDNRIILGASGNAGHIGHVIVNLDGLPCACGGRGCVETVASGPSMVDWALNHGWDFSSFPTEGEPTAIDLAAAARLGDETALAAFQRSGRALAAGIVSAAALCDITRAVIGGGVVHAADILFPPLRAAISEYACLDFLATITIEAAELGTSAGLIGAAAMIFEPQRYYRPECR